MAWMADGARRIAAGMLAGLAMAPAAAEDMADRLPLWLVEDEDTRIHLFGTVHLLPEGLDWFDDELRARLEGASTLWLEIDDPGDAATAQALVAAHGFSEEGPLSDRLDEALHARLAAVADAYGVPVVAMQMMEPWLVGLQLAGAAFMAGEARAEMAADLVLREAALEAGLEIDGLETMEDQVLMLAGLSEAAQIGFLESAIADLEADEGSVDALFEAWAAGDLAALERLALDDLAEQAELHQAMIVERNEAWAEAIIEMLEEPGAFFVAVGAAHLVGPDSVQNALEARGIAVERVR